MVWFISGKSTRQVAESNARWCDTLTLLTAQPVTPSANPRANPSRVGEYALYEDLVRLGTEFGCHSNWS
jgi:hypothetical protein